MKITKQHLKQIIKEELSKVLNEEEDPSDVGFKIVTAFKNKKISKEAAIKAIDELDFGDDPNFTDVQHKNYFKARLDS